jgi:hypothetical protein
MVSLLLVSVTGFFYLYQSPFLLFALYVRNPAAQKVNTTNLSFLAVLHSPLSKRKVSKLAPGLSDSTNIRRRLNDCGKIAAVIHA